MNKSKFISFAILVALFAATATLADNASTIASYINTTANPSLSASISGSTVTVTGTLSATPSGANYLTLNIDAGVTVQWQATLQGSPNSSYSLINISGGSGTFRVSSGTIENTGSGRAITNNSASTVNIQGGTVKTGGNYAIYNASTGSVSVSSGRVESTASSGDGIYNSSSGAVTVSGGTVTAYRAINNRSTGAVNISGGTISTTTGDAINNYNSSGTVSISNATISATTGDAIYISGGTVSISNATISATTGYAIRGSGTITISGSSTRITSANTSSSGGTIYFNGKKLNISGGTVENTATGTNANATRFYAADTINVSGGTIKSNNGNAIYSYSSVLNISGGTISTTGNGKAAVFGESSGTIVITGGTISATQSDGYAIQNSSSHTLSLGRSPTITGKIYTYPDKLSVLASGTDIFAPGTKVYTLDFPTAEYVNGRVAVVNGGGTNSFLQNFTLYNSGWALSVQGAHLGIVPARTVSFDLNGGTGTTPVSISVASGGKVYTKPSTSGITKTGYTSDGNWYVGTSATAAEFLFGDGGTSVNGNITLYLRWIPDPPNITTQPTNGTVTAETTRTISVTATAGGTISYQWYSNTSASTTGGTAVGTNSASYTIPASSTTTVGTQLYHYVIIINTQGGLTSTRTSNVATTTIIPQAPTINVHPTSNALTAELEATHEISVTATAPPGGVISYQWYSNTTASNGGGTLLSGQTSSSLSVPISEGGVFYRYVVVTNTQGGRTATTSSNLSTITVNPPLPTIGTQPANRTLALGEPCNLSVTATLPATGGVLIYQWYSNASASASGGTTIGTNSSSYSAPTSKIGENYYYVIVTNTQGGRTATITSNAVKVTVNPTITTQPTNKSVLSGAMAEFTVGTELNGASSLTYNWQVSTNNGSSFSDVYNGTGYTTTSYTTPAATLAMNGYRYRCIVTNNFGGIDTSGVATLTVTAPPAITTQSVNNSVNYGETAGFTIAAALNGASSLTYQWQVSSDGTIFSNVSNGTGGTSASYTTPAATMAINGYLYRCIVSSIYGSDTSNIATLTVNVIPPSITTQPANKTIPYSETAIFAVEAAANGASLLTYQWQRSTKGGLSYSNVSDGIGGTSASYETPAATVKMSGYRYRCIVTNNLAQSDTSYVATLNVNKAVLTWNTDGAASNKVYDGTTIATVNTEPTLIGVISGDDVIPAAGMVNFSDANAGIAKVVTAIDYGITGTDIDNYLAPTEQPVFAKANITALQLAWNTDGAVSNKTYDGTTIATVSTEPSLVGVISYDDVTPVVGTVNFSDAHVGIGKTVIATGYDITGANASNYIVPDSQPVFAKADIMSPQDDIDIALAKATIEDTDFSSVAQSSLNTKGMANGFVADIIAELELNGVEAVVTAVNFQAAVAGTVANESGTNGSYTFTVTLSKGIGIPQTTTTLTLAIVATSYGNTPIHFPQLVTSNHAIQIPNGINLQVASNTIVEIFNLKGNLISRQNFGSGVYTLSLGHLPKGIYIVLVGKQTLRVPVR